MQSSENKELVQWLKQNAFKRDVTAQVKKDFTNKSLNVIIADNLDEDQVKEIEIWKQNLGDIKSWYELEYFFERSYDEMSETWFSGELITYIPSSDSDDEEELSMCWGVKGDFHLDLKLREWADRLTAEVHLADVYDEIPKKFGGDLEGEGRFKFQDGNWVKFRYDSNRKEIIDPAVPTYTSFDDILRNNPTQKKYLNEASIGDHVDIQDSPYLKNTTPSQRKRVEKVIKNALWDSSQRNFYKSIGEELPNPKGGLWGIVQKGKEMCLGIFGMMFFGITGLISLIIGVGILIGVILLLTWIVDATGVF